MPNLRELLGRPDVHPFPARMAPELAWDYVGCLRPGAVVLDPMAGSGTVLALAQQSLLRTKGFDADPLAVLLSRVWTTPIDHNAIRSSAKRILSACEAAHRRSALEFPSTADGETRAFISYWFDRRSRQQLSLLSGAISRIREPKVRRVLLCALSRTIIAKSGGVSRAMDLAHSRPHRAYLRSPSQPLQVFEEAVERVLSGVPEESRAASLHASEVSLGDARKLPLRAASIDLIFSSPPYLNAIDYLRCSKFSLVWMGHTITELRRIRRASIGTSAGGKPTNTGLELAKFGFDCRGASARFASTLARYAEDSLDVMRESNRVLRPGGRLVYVIGENFIRGRHIRTGRIAEAAAEVAGLVPLRRSTRSLPPNRRYLPPPSDAGAEMDGRMTTELILEFEKPTN